MEGNRSKTSDQLIIERQNRTHSLRGWVPAGSRSRLESALLQVERELARRGALGTCREGCGLPADPGAHGRCNTCAGIE